MSTTPRQPRGIRNNNPGNIRWGDSWQGLVQLNQRTDPDFCQFIAPEYGIRAMAVVLRNYRKYLGAVDYGGPGIDSVYEIIRRWAPSTENDTNSYISSVCDHMDVAPRDRLDLNDYFTMRELIEAIILHENGQQPYTEQQLHDGLRRAGYAIN